MLMTPWALTTFGAATADAVAVAAATLRKLRRVGRAILDDFDMAFLSLRSGRRWRPHRFDHQVAYSPLNDNSIASIAAKRINATIAYLPAPVTLSRRNALLGRTV